MTDSGFDPLNQPWSYRLQGYLRHKNDEHLEALVLESQRYFEARLIHHLPASSSWHTASGTYRIAALLFLFDRGMVDRVSIQDNSWYYWPASCAESWILSQPAMLPIAEPMLELLSALRRDVTLNQSSTSLKNEEPA